MQLNKAIDNFKNHLQEKEKSQETISGYERDLNKLKNFLERSYNGMVFLDDITSKDIDDYFYHLKNTGRHEANSRNRYLYAIKSLFKFAQKKGYVKENIARDVEPAATAQKIPVYLTYSEMQRFREALEHELISVVVITLYYTGLRISELINLKTYHINFQQGYVYVLGKGKKERMIPLSRKLKPILLDYLQNKRPRVNSDHFFATKRTGKLSRVYVSERFKQANDKLNWKKQVTPHKLRHSFATNLIREGAELPYVQRLLGHENIETTTVYISTDYEDLEKTVNLL